MAGAGRRLCIVSQWYPPEQAPFGKMMEELASFAATCGWNVTVLTGFPNHPSGQIFAGYRKQWLLEERLSSEVTVKRVWLWTSARNSTTARLLRFASFTLASMWRLLREPRADVVFAVLQPLSLGALLPIVARLKRSRLVLDIQDLHPDTQIRLGLVRNRLWIGVLRAVESYAYRSCAALVVICEPFRRHVIARGALPERVSVVENWIDTQRVQPLSANNEFRSDAGLSAADFVVLWAGTLGYVSGAALIIDAAALLCDQTDIKFLVVGEGPLLESLVARSQHLGLQNVIFRPFQPEERLGQVLASADVSLVVLSTDFAETSVPSKVLAYMAAGRGVVAAVPAKSPTAALIETAEAGVVVGPGDARELAEAIKSLYADRDRARSLGSAGRRYAVANLSSTAGVSRLERALRQALASK
jgi:colanic acid biosynthesis glycosyl transferase WcaI